MDYIEIEILRQELSNMVWSMSIKYSKVNTAFVFFEDSEVNLFIWQKENGKHKKFFFWKNITKKRIEIFLATKKEEEKKNILNQRKLSYKEL